MDLSQEEKLIFFYLRINRDSHEERDVMSLPTIPIDWSKVINLSGRHQIMPLLYRNLTSLSPLNHIPENILGVLKDVYFANLYRNTALWKEFGQILDLAEDVNIKIIPFKGIILSRSIYRDPALRVFADIDILVKEEDISKFKTLILNIGYKGVKRKGDRLFMRPVTPALSSCLELHTVFVPPRPYAIQIPQLWERAKEEVVDGRRLDCLSREDTFLSLALHLRRHTRILLFRFIYDIARLLNLYGHTLDWKYIEDLAGKNHIKNCIYFCLYICRELLGVSVSGKIIDKFNPGIFSRKLMYLCMNRRNFLRPAFWQGYMLRILLFDRPRDIFIYALHVPGRRKALK